MKSIVQIVSQYERILEMLKCDFGGNYVDFLFGTKETESKQKRVILNRIKRLDYIVGHYMRNIVSAHIDDKNSLIPKSIYSKRICE